MRNIVSEIEDNVIKGQTISFEEAVRLSQTEDVEALFAVADKIRVKFKGNKVDLCSIMNAKSGRCSENCKYCAQSGHYYTGIEEYPLVCLEDALKMARENEQCGVHRFSLVTSGRAINGEDFYKIIEMIKVLKQETKLKLCASLGCISYDQAVELKKAGLTMYHHNVETSSDYFDEICDTHAHQDRMDTIKNVTAAGLDVCCGGIIGMGESMEQRIKMAFEINELGVKFIPINILNPIKGTPLEKAEKLNPIEILKTFSIFRFIIPNGSIRYAGGRNALGELQGVGLKAGVDGVMVGNYLTTVGNKISDDIRMIKGLGLEV